jgi:hypothetical protein
MIQEGGTNFLILFAIIRRNCPSSGMNLLLHLLIKRVIKLSEVVIAEYYCQ